MERSALRPLLEQLHRRHDTRCRKGREMRRFHGGERAGECGRQAMLPDNTRQPDTEGSKSHRYEISPISERKSRGHPKEEDPTSGCPFFHAATGRITTVSG